jgi:hypothetical protein
VRQSKKLCGLGDSPQIKLAVMEKFLFYIREAISEVEYANRCYDDFEKSSLAGNTDDIFFNLHHFIVHIANVDKLLNPSQNSKRTAILAGKIDMSGIDLKTFRKLRNHLEHFDERLDKWVTDYDGHAFFDKNIVTGARAFPRKAFLRALDGDVFRFHGDEYPLAELKTTIAILLLRLRAAKVGDG